MKCACSADGLKRELATSQPDKKAQGYHHIAQREIEYLSSEKFMSSVNAIAVASANSIFPRCGSTGS
jgi:hypothetical protein